MATIEELLDIMVRLRDPRTGCPWDREQSFSTIVPHTLEEAYEVADVIERERWEELPDELGDLLFQIVFYAQIASEQGRFRFDTVVDAICRKLKERHPHVFGGERMAGSGEQSQRWEELKADQRREQGEPGVLDGVALGLPALTRAAKLQKRAAQVGFDWPEIGPVFEKVAEELGEVRRAIEDEKGAELGDLLFACVNLARHLGVDPEQALRGANRRFDTRFRYVETRLQATGRHPRDASLAEMDQFWEEAKLMERGP